MHEAIQGGYSRAGSIPSPGRSPAGAPGVAHAMPQIAAAVALPRIGAVVPSHPVGKLIIT